MFAFIGNLSPSEIAIILVLGLLLFGSRLPQVGRSIGKSLAEFKRGLSGIEDEMREAEAEARRKPSPTEALDKPPQDDPPAKEPPKT